ncbi:MAG: hypothetical protein E7658_07480 [Ruminococcaceae bacterium]|nr:hypothetical protein [Oscillospiraceae bacterium]
MDFDVKELIEKAIDALKADDNLLENFKKEPVKTLEKLLKIDLPDEKLDAVIDGIKAKLAIDDVSDVLGKLGGLFGKKD